MQIIISILHLLQYKLMFLVTFHHQGLCTCLPPVHFCEKNKNQATCEQLSLAHRCFSMTMKTNPAYTHFCFLSDSVCVRESLPLSSLNKGLISASVEYVNPFGGPLALSLCPRDPHCPTLPSQVGKRGSGITSAEAWWARTSSPG